VVYSNSFTGPEIFDDVGSISRNPQIRSLWPLTEAMKAPRPDETTAGRPILCLSLAANYAVTGLEVWSYHAFNLVVHIVAGMALFGIIRRTLLTERMPEHLVDHSWILALVCALIWLVHPLQTQAVTYIIQRAESMMGMFYLLTLYSAIRSFHSRRAIWWQLAAAAFCALGMGTKEVMVTAPLIVLIYDRIFVGKNFRNILTKRWMLYSSLAATWLLLGAILWQAPRGATAGFSLRHVTPIQYALTQPSIILHYLRLSFWPSRLVLDYGWPVAGELGNVVPALLAVCLLLAGTFAALRYWPAIGFCGLWVFVILSPTSSFVPIADLAYEHRMYLSLAAIVSVVVCCTYALSARFLPRARQAKLVAGIAVAMLLAGSLGWRTYKRNEDYGDSLRIWRDTVSGAPRNYRAHYNLALGYDYLGNDEMALAHYDISIALDSTHAGVYNNRGAVHAERGNFDKAIDDYSTAIRLEPQRSSAYTNRALAYRYTGRDNAALEDLNKAVEIDPNDDQAYHQRAMIYRKLGKDDLAISDLSMAIRLKPDRGIYHQDRAAAYLNTGLHDLAIADCQAVIRLDDTRDMPYRIRASAFCAKGDHRQAITDLDKAAMLNPKEARIYGNRGAAYQKLGRHEDAIRDCTRAIELDPHYAPAYINRGIARSHIGQYDLAIADFEKAIQLDPCNKEVRLQGARALSKLADAMAGSGRLGRAMETLTRAVRLAADAEDEQLAQTIAAKAKLYKAEKVP